ncbi:translation termination factor GTPase eRF3 [Tulasnella sp. 419]|nr:translation termination factor GTPase eRF3 [Tulasnella sp. 419]
MNPNAYSFVPGQSFVPRGQQHQQQQPGQQSADGNQQSNFQNPYAGPQQQPPYYWTNPQTGYPYAAVGAPPNMAFPGGPNHAQYLQQGGGRPYTGPGSMYNPTSMPPHPPPSQQAYVPPQQRYQQQQQQQQSAPIVDTSTASGGGNIAAEPKLPPPADRPAGQTIKLNIGGSGPSTVPTGQTIKLNIGGSSSGTATPPKQAEPKGSSTPTAAKKVKESNTAPTSSSSSPAPPVNASKGDEKFNFSKEKAKTDADAILEEQKNVVDEETLKDLYGERERAEDANSKQHLNIVFIGHVDAGKSTMGGQILYLCDMVDKRTMEKYEREAKEAGRETWYLSWALDSTPQERAKGKTVEVGRAYFETTARRYTILDAPGHKTFVPSMISGAAQADVALLVISARKGEFETGFEKGGQTREHIMLVKTAGVQKIIVVVNKMDDPTVEWKKERYDEIKDKLIPFIKGSGFNPKTDVTFIPVSAYTGVNMKEENKAKLPWWDGPTLLGLLDTMPMVDRKTTGPLMMPISEKYKDMGTVVVGKIESGRLRKGDTLLLMPNKVTVEVAAINNEMEEEVPYALSGDNVRIRLRGIEDEDISPGFVLTSPNKPVHAVKQFEAQLAILEHKNIICAGYGAVMHVHTASEEVQLNALLHYFDKKTGRKSKKPPQFAKKGQKIIALIETTGLMCVEKFDDYPQLGRFTLRDEGKTVAIGKITKLIESQEIADEIAKMTLQPGTAAA